MAYPFRRTQITVPPINLDQSLHAQANVARRVQQKFTTSAKKGHFDEIEITGIFVRKYPGRNDVAVVGILSGSTVVRKYDIKIPTC